MVATPRRHTPGQLPHLPADVVLVALVLAAANLPLLWDHPPQALFLQLPEVAAGQWWRLLTHPLAHVSGYHLLLDGAAFLLLYPTVGCGSAGHRLGLTLGAALGSTLVAVALSDQVARVGLCGLSGVAHGLCAVAAAELAWPATGDAPAPIGRRLATLLLALLGAKVALEMAGGTALFTGLHWGDIGQPIVACHLGGVGGGLLAKLVSTRKRAPSTNPASTGGRRLQEGSTDAQRQVYSPHATHEGSHPPHTHGSH